VGREDDPREEEAPRNRGEGRVVGGVQRVVLVADGAHEGRGDHRQVQARQSRHPAHAQVRLKKERLILLAGSMSSFQDLSHFKFKDIFF